MALTYDERSLDIKDITVRVGDVCRTCCMHRKIWIAHLLYWVGIRCKNERLNKFIDSITDKRKPGTLAEYWKYAPSNFDPFLCINDIEHFINDNIATSKFIHYNTDYAIPPKNLINVCLEVTLENYKVICTQYAFLATGLKVGDRLMVYNNTFKNECLIYSFYTQNVSNHNNLCAGCKSVKKIQFEKREKEAYRRYIAGEKTKYERLSSNVYSDYVRISNKDSMCKYLCGNQCAPGLTRNGNHYDTCCKKCALSNGNTLHHDLNCIERNKISSNINENEISFKVLHSKDNEWKNDSTTKHCIRCKKEFTFFNRKHHCRICGNIICNTCSLITSKNDKNIIKEIGTFQIVKVKICTTCSNRSLLYCNGAKKNEKEKWVYKGK